MRNKIIILVVVLVLAIGGGLAAFWPFHKSQVLRLSGIVEVQEVRLGSKVGGRVEQVLIKEGDMIDATYTDRALVVFEAPELRNQRQQAKARLDAAQAEWLRAKNGPRQEEIDAARAGMKSAGARWERAKFGWREEEKKQADNDLQIAQADYDQALKEWNRVVPLYRRQAVSGTDYEAAIAAKDRALGRKESARWRDQMLKAGTRQEDKDEAQAEFLRAQAQFKLLDNGTRTEDKDLAQAKFVELKAKLEEIDISLAETTITVPPNLGKAVVEVVAVRPGDLVPANQPVLRVLRVKDLWVKIFVPETQYGLVKLNHQVDVTIDSRPGVVFKGIVIQKSNISEFTPRNVQSVDERHHQVFAVKIQILEPQGVFNAGMSAEVVIPLD